MKSELIREKAYKRLAYEYSSLNRAIIHKCRSLVEYSKTGDDALKLVSSIADMGNWERNGIQSREESRMVEMLEYLLDDNQPVK